MENRLDSVWKDNFIKYLFNNKEEETNLFPMWRQFVNGILSNQDIKAVVENSDGLFQCEVKDNLIDLAKKTNNCADFLDELGKDSSFFRDDDWKILLILLRDRESKIIDKEKTIRIMEGGHERSMNIEELQEKFMEDYPYLLTTQSTFPDQLLHNDQERRSTENLIHEIKNLYEENRQTKLVNLKKDYPKKNAKELYKQAEREAKDETVKSKKGQLVASRFSLEAEDNVQKAIKKAAKVHEVPVVVFRGVNTFADVCKHLEDFGIKASTLKNFSKPSSSNSQECENDIVVVALTTTGPVVSFIQVFI